MLDLNIEAVKLIQDSLGLKKGSRLSNDEYGKLLLLVCTGVMLCDYLGKSDSKESLKSAFINWLDKVKQEAYLRNGQYKSKLVDGLKDMDSELFIKKANEYSPEMMELVDKACSPIIEKQTKRI